MKIRAFLARVACLSASASMIACNTSDGDKGPSADLKKKALATYADIVYATYVDARDAGADLKAAVDAFVAAPSQATQDAAKAAWKKSRIPYLQTEVYRFYDGPIDNATDGPEGLLNSWPLDEAHIDYVKDDAETGIINMPDTYPDITADVISSANGNPGEADISTGYHAIEFLLWGQDLDTPDKKTAGQRPYTDFVSGTGGTAYNQARRGAYIKAAANLLVDNLDQLVEAWAPDKDNYRKEFLAADPDSSLAKILIGMGSLSGGELSGERMTVAMSNGDQEDEHSCFSDNTHIDIIYDAQGIQNVYLGSYEKADGHWVKGTGLYDVLKVADASLADKLKDQLAASVEKAKAIEAPFDHAISLGNTAGRAKVQADIDALKAQAGTIGDAARAFGITLNLE
jgi:putative iron-regulated protein